MTVMFAYDETITSRYPAIRAGALHTIQLSNAPSDPKLLEEYRAEQTAIAEKLKAAPIAELPSIAAWRRAFSGFGAKPTQHRNAAEALLRRLDKHGEIPTINTLVDIGNLVSIRYAMPVAVFDQAAVAAPTTVRFATGSEVFTELGADSSVHPEPGEVVFVDRVDVVSARRWCWRQSAQSAARADTIEALITVEGQHDGAERDIESAVDDLVSLLATYQPQAQVKAGILSPVQPHLTA